MSSVASAVIYQNGQPTQPLIDLGTQLSAANGGPSVTMVINSPDFTPGLNNLQFHNGELVLSGTLGPRDQTGHLTVFGGSHSIYFQTIPSHITRIRLYTGTNYLTDPGQMLEVDMSTLRLAPGANGTLQSLDLFGARVIGDVPGLASITIGGAATGETVRHGGVGLAASVYEATSGTYQPRDFKMRAWNAVVENASVSTVSDEFMNASRFGGALQPPQGSNGRITQGDSNGPVIRHATLQYSTSGRVNSLQLCGIGVGFTLPTAEIGNSFYVDLGNTTAARFVNQFTGQGLTPGDATANGAVNFDDLLVLAQNYGQLTGHIWGEGDFTGDTAVNFDDLLILAQHYGSGPAVVEGVSAEFSADWAVAQSLVPEPSSLLIAITPALIRRNRAGR